jgi:hypothetical protein
MTVLDIASNVGVVNPDGVTPKSMEFELTPAQSLRRRALHVGLASANFSSGGSQFWLDVDFIRGHSKLQTQRFCLFHHGDSVNQTGRYPCPGFYVLQSDPASQVVNSLLIPQLSGRSPSLAGNMLMWPIDDVLGGVSPEVADVLYTSPIEFVADIDRVTVRTVPLGAQWIPLKIDASADCVVAIACAIVSTSL